MVLLWFFITIFFITNFLWYIAGEAFALAPYDGKLFALNLLLVALLATLPFTARLALFSEIEELAVTLLLINTGVVFALTALINTVVLRKPECQNAPRPVLSDLLAQQYALPAGSLVPLLFLLTPSGEVLEAPFTDLDIPVRTLGFLWSFFIFFAVMMVAEFFVRRRIPPPAEESREAEKMGRVLHSKMRDVNNALFEMALGLSVFSLTDLPVQAASDLIPPLLHFAFLFLLIVVFWNKLFRVYAALPVWEEGVDFLTGMVAFFAVLIPPAFRFAVIAQPETKAIGGTIFPVLMAGLAAVNAMLYLYAASSKRGEATVTKEVAREFHRWAAGSLILTCIFLASLLIQLEATVFWEISMRASVWWISLLGFIAMMQITAYPTPSVKQKKSSE